MNTATMLSSGDLWTIATLFCWGFPSLLLSLRDTDYQLSANKTRLNTEFCCTVLQYYIYITTIYYIILYYTILYTWYSKNISCIQKTSNVQIYNWGEKNYASPIRFFLLQQSENLNSNIRVTNCEWLPGYRRWLIVKAFSLLPRFSHIGKWFVSPFPVKMSDIILYISQPLQVP